MEIGLIADTHNLVRPEALDALAGVKRIVHAGDVCSPEILEQLRTIAPVDVIRGNCDYGEWAEPIPLSDTFELGGVLLHAVHDVETLEIDPRAAGVHVVLSGHTHEPAELTRDGVLYVNPGSAGPRRFRLPVSLAVMSVRNGRPRIRFVSLL
ncbi:MAG: metallophosphatase family protein [Acidobacteriota bacterium]|nr:metallophosphatase family protein [Acidobacteriota bacterium]